MSTPTDPCRAVSLVAVRPRIATVVDLDGPADPDALMCYRHAQWMANKERRWCSLPFGHDGGHDFTLTESPFGDTTDAAPTDPLVLALCNAAFADFEACRQEDDGADPKPAVAEAYLSACARLSAVIAAARAMLGSDDETNGRVPGWIVEDLRGALAAADAEVKP